MIASSPVRLPRWVAANTKVTEGKVEMAEARFRKTAERQRSHQLKADDRSWLLPQGPMPVVQAAPTPLKGEQTVGEFEL